MANMEEQNNTEITTEINNNLINNQDSEPQHGGKREGSGRPKGAVSTEKKLQQEALDRFKARVRMRMGRLFNAQASLAEGMQYMIRIETTKDSKGKEIKKHVRVTDPDEMIRALDEGLGDVDGDYYYLTSKDPDNKALDSLMDRTFGKAPQAVDLTSKGKRIEGYVLEIIDKREHVEKGDETEDSSE